MLVKYISKYLKKTKNIDMSLITYYKNLYKHIFFVYTNSVTYILQLTSLYITL